jgi:hypothetical protein
MEYVYWTWAAPLRLAAPVNRSLVVRLLCFFFGHQPIDYGGIHCARCGQRRHL